MNHKYQYQFNLSAELANSISFIISKKEWLIMFVNLY